jgi:hypothetical protein
VSLHLKNKFAVSAGVQKCSFWRPAKWKTT